MSAPPSIVSAPSPAFHRIRSLSPPPHRVLASLLPVSVSLPKPPSRVRAILPVGSLAAVMVSLPSMPLTHSVSMASAEEGVVMVDLSRVQGD